MQRKRNENDKSTG